MRSYSSDPMTKPEYIDYTPDGDIVELGVSLPTSDEGAIYAPLIPRVGLGAYNRFARSVVSQEAHTIDFKLTHENAPAVTDAINHVRQLIFLGVPNEVIGAGFAAAVKPYIPETRVQYHFVSTHLSD